MHLHQIDKNGWKVLKRKFSIPQRRLLLELGIRLRDQIVECLAVLYSPWRHLYSSWLWWGRKERD